MTPPLAPHPRPGRVEAAPRGALDLFLLISGLALPALAAWLYFVVLAASPALPALYAACKIAQFALPFVWLLLLGGRPEARSPFTARGLAGGAGGGAMLAAGVLMLYLLALRGGDLAAGAAPRIAARLEALHCATPSRFVALALFLSLAHSFLEEYYWRWFAFGRLRAYVGMRGAIVLSSAAFAAHHVIVLHAFTGSGRFLWATVLFSLAVAAAGALWAWQYARTRSLLPVWVGHALVDLAIMAIAYDLVWGAA